MTAVNSRCHHYHSHHHHHQHQFSFNAQLITTNTAAIVIHVCAGSGVPTGFGGGESLRAALPKRAAFWRMKKKKIEEKTEKEDQGKRK